LAIGAGERAADVAEQLGFEQRLGNGAAVDGDEPLLAARAGVVNRARGQFFAGARLAAESARCSPSTRQCAADRRDCIITGVRPDDAVDAEAIVKLSAQVGVLRPAAAPFRVAIVSSCSSSSNWNGLVMNPQRRGA
jgi:hypothetical protein